MPATCRGCLDGEAFTVPFTMAFQPIVDVSTGAIFAHEALVRGLNGEGAGTILASVDDTNRYAFDQQCRVKAIEIAASLDLASSESYLSINFLPNAVYEPRACIRATLAAAARADFPVNRIIFEFTEAERLDTRHLLNILSAYREMGFRTAIDDFGAGYAGIDLLSKFQPDILKLDMALTRGIDSDPVRRSIVQHLLALSDDLGIMVICEGIETQAELRALQYLGVKFIQGYLLAKPAMAMLAKVNDVGLGAPSATTRDRTSATK